MPTLLLIESEFALRNQCRELFEAAGWTVLAASNAKRALSMLPGRKIDAIVTDVHLEGINGLVFLAALRKLGIDESVVIGINADALSAGEKVIASAIEPEMILARPFGPEDLLDAIAEHVAFVDERLSPRLTSYVSKARQTGALDEEETSRKPSRRIPQLDNLADEIRLGMRQYDDGDAGMEALAASVRQARVNKQTRKVHSRRQRAVTDDASPDSKITERSLNDLASSKVTMRTRPPTGETEGDKIADVPHRIAADDDATPVHRSRGFRPLTRTLDEFLNSGSRGDADFAGRVKRTSKAIDKSKPDPLRPRRASSADQPRDVAHSVSEGLRTGGDDAGEKVKFTKSLGVQKGPGESQVSFRQTLGFRTRGIWNTQKVKTGTLKPATAKQPERIWETRPRTSNLPRADGQPQTDAPMESDEIQAGKVKALFSDEEFERLKQHRAGAGTSRPDVIRKSRERLDTEIIVEFDSELADAINTLNHTHNALRESLDEESLITDSSPSDPSDAGSTIKERSGTAASEFQSRATSRVRGEQDHDEASLSDEDDDAQGSGMSESLDAARKIIGGKAERLAFSREALRRKSAKIRAELQAEAEARRRELGKRRRSSAQGREKAKRERGRKGDAADAINGNQDETEADLNNAANGLASTMESSGTSASASRHEDQRGSGGADEHGAGAAQEQAAASADSKRKVEAAASATELSEDARDDIQGVAAPPVRLSPLLAQACADGKKGATRIVSILGRNKPLAQSLLELLRSDLFELVPVPTTLEDAALALGAEGVRDLIMAKEALTDLLAARAAAGHAHALDTMRFMRHTSIVGAASYRLARNMQYLRCRPTAACAAGWLHDIGMLVLDGRESGYAQVLQAAGQEEGALSRLERERFGTTHCDAAKAHLRNIGVSRELLHAISCHHLEAASFESDALFDPALGATLVIADRWANLLGMGMQAGRLPDIEAELFSRAGLSPHTAREAMTGLIPHGEACLRYLFDKGIGASLMPLASEHAGPAMTVDAGAPNVAQVLVVQGATDAMSGVAEFLSRTQPSACRSVDASNLARELSEMSSTQKASLPRVVFSAFGSDEDEIAQVIDRATEAGVPAMVVVASGWQAPPEAVQIAYFAWRRGAALVSDLEQS